MPSDELIRHGAHVMTVCNACRYCEGYCPVFPAMENLQVFSKSDMLYLANLCHNCGECLYACQYAPPHEFGINVPKTLAETRLLSYEEYCWPRPLSAAFRQRTMLTAFALPAGLIALMMALRQAFGSGPILSGSGNFYSVVPHGVMVGMFGGVSLFVMTALVVGLVRFWRDQGSPSVPHAGAVLRAIKDALTLRHLHESGTECTDAEESRSGWRRRFHHFTVYGFTLCFASTTVAAIYHSILGWEAPYAYTSVPVVLGTVGGLGLVIGPAGLYWRRLRRDPDLGDPEQQGMDTSFLALLFMSSATGLLLLIVRSAQIMSVALLVHLGFVLTLFLTMPYGKFVHGLYRTAALVKYALENTGQDVAPEVQELPVAAYDRAPAPITSTLSR